MLLVIFIFIFIFILIIIFLKETVCKIFLINTLNFNRSKYEKYINEFFKFYLYKYM